MVSDLVGNPEDQFSRIAAHFADDYNIGKERGMLLFVCALCFCPFFPPGILIEPVHEKTNILGFQPGLTQTGLYSHKRWLEA